jgi:hypothetical protein
VPILTAAQLKALVGGADPAATGMPLPDRNPTR